MGNINLKNDKAMNDNEKYKETGKGILNMFRDKPNCQVEYEPEQEPENDEPFGRPLSNKELHELNVKIQLKKGNNNHYF